MEDSLRLHLSPAKLRITAPSGEHLQNQITEGEKGQRTWVLTEMIPFSRISLFEYILHDLWLLGMTDRQEVLEGLHFVLACYVSRCFIFILERESTSHCPVEAETDERSLEVCTMSRVWKGKQGRQRMCWRTVLELCSVSSIWPVLERNL